MSILRTVVDATTSVVGWLKRNRRRAVPTDGAPVKVNLGCGLAVAPGWINIDGSLNALVATLPRALHHLAYRVTGANRYYSEAEYCRLLGGHTFVHHDLAYGVPLPDESTDFVYSSHFLEHLFRKDAEHLLLESYRVLKVGGTVRISIPDLEYALSLYAMGDKETMLTQYFFVEDDDSYYARHKYMYDYAMLENTLESLGFRDVRRCAFREGRTPDLAILDNRPEESLFVEALR